MTNRTTIINDLISKYNLKSYCELGVEGGLNFEAINLPIDFKIGVDPDPTSKATVIQTSDEFFIFAKEQVLKFDIFFVDSLHIEEYAYRDIVNSLDHLEEGGFVVVHDLLPPTYESQLVPRIQDVWVGSTWKAWVKLRSERNDLTMSVVDTDYGVGIIQKGKQTPIILNVDLNYDNFIRYKNHWLNLTSISEFKEKYLD